MSRLGLLCLAPALVVGCSSPPSPDQPRAPGAVAAKFTVKPSAEPKLGPDTRDYDQENLALDLDLDMDAGSLRGTATHTLTALADLTKLRMHLMDMTVSSVTSDGGATCTATQADDVLTISLDRPRRKGERFTLKIAYGGRPKSGLWFFKPTAEHPEVPLQVWSQGEGEENRHWIPCYDLPDDRLTTSIRVVVPAGLQTLSNGDPKGTESLADGRVAHTWVLDRAHVSYLITLVVGTFDDVKRDAAGVEQHDLVPPGWAPWCDEVFGRTPSMMDFFETYTAQPFPWGRYSQVTVWDFSWGGMENTGATTLNMRALHKEGVRPDYSADGLVAHELAHDWFGDLITCRTFNHIWLNEGFATYFTDLWDESYAGADQFAVDCLGQREGYMNGVDLGKTSEAPRPAKPTDCGDMSEHQYVKGASVLHMLRKLLGDDVFQRAIRRYVRDNRDKSVESEALRASLEAESKQDLKWFFDQWVYGSGFPELEASWAFDEAAHEARLLLRQTQPITATMPVFQIPFDVGIVDADGKSERMRATMTRASQEFVVPTKAGQKRPTLTFDPDHWLLARIHEIKPRAAWEAQLADDKSNVGRIFAARALAEFGPDGVPALAKASKGDPHWSVRAEACTALGRVRWNDDAARALVAAAEDKESRVRRAAVGAMGDSRSDAPGVEHVCAMHPAGTPRVPCATTPDRMPSGAVTATFAEVLKKRLATDPSVYVAADAGASLGKTKAPGAYEALVAGLQRESHRDQIRQRIMDGLKELGDKRGAEVAMRHLDYAWGKGIQHQLRHSAFDAMVALAPDAPETRRWIVKLLRDPYFRMKTWAAEAAAKLKVGEALPVMEELAETAIGPGVAEAMKKNADKLRETLLGMTPKTEEEAACVKCAVESKMRLLEKDRAKLAKDLEESGQDR